MKPRARLGIDAKNTYFSLASLPLYGLERIAHFARVRLLRHTLPISLLILREKTTVFHSICLLLRFGGVSAVGPRKQSVMKKCCHLIHPFILIHFISHLRTLTRPELDQMQLNNYYSVIILLHPYQFFRFAAKGLGSNFLPPQGDGLYFSYTGDSNSPQPFHPLDLMGHPPQSLTRFCDSRISSYIIFVQIIMSQRKRRNRNSYKRNNRGIAGKYSSKKLNEEFKELP